MTLFVCRPCLDGRCEDCTDAEPSTADIQSTGYCSCDNCGGADVSQGADT